MLQPQTKHVFKCGNCGYKSAEMFIFCPVCDPQPVPLSFCPHCGFPENKPVPRQCPRCAEQITTLLLSQPAPKKKLELWSDPTGSRFYGSRFRIDVASYHIPTSYDASAIDGLRRTHEVILHPYEETASELVYRADIVARVPVLILFANGDGGTELPGGQGEKFSAAQIGTLRGQGRRVVVID